MSVNSSSSSSNDSLLHPNLSPSDSYLPYAIDCIAFGPSSLIYTSFFLTYTLLLLPLSLSVLYLGVRRWQQHHSTSTAAKTSHADSFTYHMVAIELIGVFGHVVTSCGIFMKQVILVTVGFHFWTFLWCMETLFHLLTCVERYLAVVHPVTYLSLRGETGIRIRNITVGCVWLLSFGLANLASVEDVYLILCSCLTILTLIIISFCSLAVLRVLIRPGPGDKGGDRERVDQSKLRAFYTIMAILAALVLRCSCGLFWVFMTVVEARNDCLLMVSVIWLNLPSSLVLPLLFLHRKGALMFCKSNN